MNTAANPVISEELAQQLTGQSDLPQAENVQAGASQPESTADQVPAADAQDTTQVSESQAAEAAPAQVKPGKVNPRKAAVARKTTQRPPATTGEQELVEKFAKPTKPAVITSASGKSKEDVATTLADFGLAGRMSTTARLVSREEQFAKFVDGETAIRVDLKGETAIGRFLHPASGFAFDLDIGDGKTKSFNSVLGAVLLLKKHTQPNLGEIYGEDAVNLMARLYRDTWHRSHEIRRAIMEMTMIKLANYSESQTLLIDTDEPLVMWYEKAGQRMHPAMHTWFEPFLYQLREYTREQRRAEVPSAVPLPSIARLATSQG